MAKMTHQRTNLMSCISFKDKVVEFLNTGPCDVAYSFEKSNILLLFLQLKTATFCNDIDNYSILMRKYRFHQEYWVYLFSGEGGFLNSVLYMDGEFKVGSPPLMEL